jgi:hypothetical protein
MRATVHNACCTPLVQPCTHARARALASGGMRDAYGPSRGEKEGRGVRACVRACVCRGVRASASVRTLAHTRRNHEHTQARARATLPISDRAESASCARNHLRGTRLSACAMFVRSLSTQPEGRTRACSRCRRGWAETLRRIGMTARWRSDHRQRRHPPSQPSRTHGQVHNACMQPPNRA